MLGHNKYKIMSKLDYKRHPLVVYSLDELLELKIPKRQYLLSPWLQSQGLCMIYSTRGFGKTWIALEIAYTVAAAVNSSHGNLRIPQEYFILMVKCHLLIYRKGFLKLI